MTHGSLFSGIGGFDLAAEWAGWQNVFHCEWNPFGQKVLKHHFPNSISYNDITKTDFTIHRGTIDILTGGFPCQPYSQAGKRLGKEDDRHLWPHMLRAIHEIQPRYVMGENVHGLINWNGGMVFDEVQADLETAGYEVIPVVLPACAVGTAHRRDRTWFIANSTNKRLQKSGKKFRQKYQLPFISSIDVSRSPIAQLDKAKRGSGNVFNCNGIPAQLDEISLSEWKRESIKAYGNAIVPQVAYEIFKVINQIETQK
jgi:DNA (cytosine-5)-methyltransferase 1